MVGCRSRRSWTVGSIHRARSWEVSVARRPCPPRPDVRLSPRQYWRCYFNVQRYLSPEVSVHFIFFRLSISGELQTIDSCPEACTCMFVTNLAGHSAIVKRKKRNQHEQVLPRTNSAFLSRRCRTCIGPATQIKTLFISAVKKKPERVCDLNEFAMSRPPDDGTNNAQSTCWWAGWLRARKEKCEGTRLKSNL